MGTLSLSCPFCCDEKFSSHNSLKYHILSIIENLFCPACDKRFFNILELTEHLNKECKDDEIEPPTETENNEIVYNIKEEVTQDTFQSNDEAEAENSNTDYLDTKFEQEESKEADSILAKALLAKSEEKSAQKDDQGIFYMCQRCDMTFISIQEHLEQYHNGEEVVLQTEEMAQSEEGIEEEQGTEELEENTFVMNGEGEEELVYEPSQAIEVEQQCLDKDGRVYTRKVVKIDKFWEDNQDESTKIIEPMTEKYLLVDGKIRKLTEDEAEAMENKDAIIEIHQCPKCYLQFPNFNHYRKHLCDPSKIKNKYKCTHCTAVFLNFESLTAHMKSHITKDASGKVKRVVTVAPYTCEICKTMFPSFKSLRLHKRMHDPIKDVVPEAPVTYSISGPVDEKREIIRHMFVCSICNKTYDKEYEEVHMRSHTQEENYDCSVCNRKFYTKENLEMHVKAHSNGKKFACSYCKKPFTTYNGLQEHVNNQCHKRLYECQYCGRRFSRPHEKVKHERIHTGEKPHICQICGKAFRVSYCLTLHLRTHSGTRPYQCKICGKRFKSHSVYNHHLLTHSDVRAYKCPYCPKAFKTSVQLAGHKNSHIKPFACTECNRPFASLYAVRAHMETHKRENNLKFDCWLCGATYARAFALKDHMKSQHAGENMGLDLESMGLELETGESTNQIVNEMETTIEENMETEEVV